METIILMGYVSLPEGINSFTKYQQDIPVLSPITNLYKLRHQKYTIFSASDGVDGDDDNMNPGFRLNLDLFKWGSYPFLP